MSKVTAPACTWREEGGGEAAAARILPFLEAIGIEVGWIGDAEAQLLDGLAIVGGRILIDPDTPVWPGDLLHEAGHIAVAAAEKRPTLGPLDPDPTDEMAAIAWSWAASLPCKLPPRQLFHDGGYRGDSAKLAVSFATGRYIGAPMLGVYGMTADLRTALAEGLPAFPALSRWLR
ncbi:MAG TPA: hypothetical protein PKD99_17775 [Sphingopyxis sp.]|nr:hypothetical protein [Sphingopyxis sp.]HMP46950.1 hypothetical protein [Sphingopyxis sp.]HMQ19259.1 hypothetical protein [Sphingopyxis sp.]